MKFSKFQYIRPNLDQTRREMQHLISDFQMSEAGFCALNTAKKIHHLQDEISSMEAICSIRYSQDTRDAYYEEEKAYWDQHIPLYLEIFTGFYRALATSRFRHDLEREFGKHYFSIIEGKLRSFSPAIIKDLQEENEICTAYSKLIASAQFDFRGRKMTLAQLGAHLESTNRNVRKQSAQSKWAFFEKNESKFDSYFDRLVKVRHRMAQKLGFDNYVALGYLRMQRDYTQKDITSLRKNVAKYVIPVVNELHEWQRQRLGLKQLHYYDLSVEYSGNSTLTDRPLLATASQMFTEMSPQTREFFNFMTKNELLDLETRTGKLSTGFCSYIPSYKSPFIFCDGNGTSTDIEVLSHEAGHAFQKYMSRHIQVPEVRRPGHDGAEIHSMSMEYFIWPWLENFFGPGAQNYKFAHLSFSMTFIPYGITVDKFQHAIYENPNWTPSQRKAAWRKLERFYLPHRNYKENPFLERGGFWYQQSHIFENPFYYIDYVLAGLCALQFWQRANHNRTAAWNDYLRLCSIGGTLPFTQLVSYANLQSPFGENCIRSTISEASQWLKKHHGGR